MQSLEKYIFTLVNVHPMSKLWIKCHGSIEYIKFIEYIKLKLSATHTS